LQCFSDSYSVMTLQKENWKLDCVLPNSYKSGIITFIWSKPLSEK